MRYPDSRVDEVFEDADFNGRFYEWQRRAEDYRVFDAALFNYLTLKYDPSDSALSEEAAMEWVSEKMEMNEEEFAETEEDPEAIERGHLRAQSLASLDVAKGDLLSVSQERGLGSFAMYGLRLYLGHKRYRSKPDLNRKVHSAEDAFGELDAVVRRSAGKLLTFVDLTVQAGILGEGGVGIVDDKFVEFPLQAGAGCVAMSLSDTPPGVYRDSRFLVQAYRIFSDNKPELPEVVDPAVNLLDPSVYKSDLPLIVIGEVPHWLLEGDDNGTKYRNKIISSVKTLGDAVLANA